MKHHGFLYRNSLSIAVVSLFLLFWALQAVTGWYDHNDMLTEEGVAAVSFAAYLTSGHFVQATFENWESEFFQMGLYVLFTVWLRQQGSSESKPLEGKSDVDREPQPSPDAPWPVRKGGVWLTLYKHSLSIAFFVLFLISFGLHAAGSYADYRFEEEIKNQAPVDFTAYMAQARFWFESFQNWQSEFLAIASIVLLSVWLRQQGSPESKPVDMPHGETPD